jgi:hypothetical protein
MFDQIFSQAQHLIRREDDNIDIDFRGGS